jgi:hypothetical protein
MRDDVLVDVAAPYLAHGLDLLAVLLGFVVLLTILMQSMASLDVGLFRTCLIRVAPFARGIAGPAFLQLLDEAAVCFLAVLAFGVSLRPGVVRLAVSHRRVSHV